MRKVTIYTDGSSLNNPGKGGYAAILIDNITKREKILHGGFIETTNNRMEIIGVIEALKALKEPCEILLYSDSEYVVNSANSWAEKWFKPAFTKRHKKKNLDLWKEFLVLKKLHTFTAKHVRGHSGDYYNEMCDQIAKTAAINAIDIDYGYLEEIKKRGLVSQLSIDM